MEINDVPVQGEGRKNGAKQKDVPAGFVDWEEHVEAWEGYSQLYQGQPPEQIAALGGFSWDELVEYLGRAPSTWRPRDKERFKEYVPPAGKAGSL